ncbi:hypothetical protein HHI36_002019 [Cryptolaemus montrouzieri]|uniref:CHK kinase-like domain-containing protein n=1 Tax=Cryptolaemus montrouzieri TaxID=559131 RepID=A0ABD2P9C2_9CUCU
MENEEKQRIIKWVHNVLKHKNFDKIYIEFPDYNTGGGYAAEMAFVDVTGDKEGSKDIISLIVKKSKVDLMTNSELNFIDLYKNEINLYSKILPHFQKMLKEKQMEPFKNIPKCYGTVNEDNRYIIILENLKNKNFKLHDITKPFDLVHTRLVFEAYAYWHALSFALEDQDPQKFKEFKECNKGFTSPKFIDLSIATINKEMDSLIEIYKEKNNRSDIIEKLKILKESNRDLSIDIFSVKDEDYQVIRHGDCWNNNFLFHYKEEGTDPDEVMIIDWQVSYAASPVLDLVCYLFYGCSREVLDHLDSLLNFYYNTLSKRLIKLGSNPNKCFPKEILIEKFKKYLPFGCAGSTLMAKMGYKTNNEYKLDPEELMKEGDFNKMFEVEIPNWDEYFNRIDGVLSFCSEHGYI